MANNKARVEMNPANVSRTMVDGNNASTLSHVDMVGDGNDGGGLAL